MSTPKLICLSATRNYGWVTRAFCKANTRWADYIIIVDQMSTDATRSICAEYDNVIVLNDTDLSYSETRRCTMALNKAREIPGDKILVYLAIDEILPANWMDTSDGQAILYSKPSDMFILEWANLMPDNKHYRPTTDANMYRIFHDDGITPYDNQGLDMHTHCLPYHYGGVERKIFDFPILHFRDYNIKFEYIKLRYYQIIDYDKNHRSVVRLSRSYDYADGLEYIWRDGDLEMKDEWLWKEFDIFREVDLESNPLLIDECKKYIEQNGLKRYSKLDIWDAVMLDSLNMQDPRTIWIKIIHGYLHKTAKYKNLMIIRAIDKLLKLFL